MLKKSLSASQVLELFCAMMLKNNNLNFNKSKLMEVIYNFKLDDKYDDLLHNVEYIGNYSRDLEKSILLFKIYGIIYNKGVGASDNLSISDFLDYNKVLKKFAKYYELMGNIIDSYLEHDEKFIKHK